MLTIRELHERRFFMVFLAGLVSMGPIAIDAYLPMIPSIADYFDTDIVTVNLTMSTFLIGMGLGQFFGGSLSDQIGRKRVGLIGLSLFCISSMCIVFAPTIQIVQALRLTQAIGSGFASVICLAQVRDIYPKAQVMQRFANIMMVVLLTPMLAPLLGAALVTVGWQSVFVLLAALALLLGGIYIILIPETLNDTPRHFSTRAMFTGYLHVLRHRVNGQLTAIRFILFTGFSSGIFMSFLTNSAFIYMEYFRFNAFLFAAIFAGHGLMMMVGNRFAVRISKVWPPLKTLSVINLLHIVVTATLAMLGYLAWLPFAAVLPLTLITISISGALMPTASGVFITYFDKNIGAAASLNTTVVFAGGASIGAVSTVISEGQLWPIFAVMGICATVARIILLSIKDSSNTQSAGQTK